MPWSQGAGRGPAIAQFPRLVGQHKEYLVKQLTDFKAGTRKNDPAGMMTDIAKKMSDAEINAVSEYLQLSCPDCAEYDQMVGCHAQSDFPGVS